MDRDDQAKLNERSRQPDKKRRGADEMQVDDIGPFPAQMPEQSRQRRRHIKESSQKQIQAPTEQKAQLRRQKLPPHNRHLVHVINRSQLSRIAVSDYGHRITPVLQLSRELTRHSLYAARIWRVTGNDQKNSHKALPSNTCLARS